MEFKSRFKRISDQEYADLVHLIPSITILIAGADNKIEKKEKEWAKKLTSIRSYASPELLNQYYEDVEKDFDEKLDQYISELPNDSVERNKILSDKIAKANSLLKKMENREAFYLYKSLLSFAKHIAKSSGGFLRFFSVSREEKRLMQLPMLSPIVYDEEE